MSPTGFSSIFVSFGPGCGRRLWLPDARVSFANNWEFLRFSAQ
jgi:hypothetical protein